MFFRAPADTRHRFCNNTADPERISRCIISAFPPGLRSGPRQSTTGTIQSVITLKWISERTHLSSDGWMPRPISRAPSSALYSKNWKGNRMISNRNIVPLQLKLEPVWHHRLQPLKHWSEVESSLSIVGSAGITAYFSCLKLLCSFTYFWSFKLRKHIFLLKTSWLWQMIPPFVRVMSTRPEGVFRVDINFSLQH